MGPLGQTRYLPTHPFTAAHGHSCMRCVPALHENRRLTCGIRWRGSITVREQLLLQVAWYAVHCHKSCKCISSVTSKQTGCINVKPPAYPRWTRQKFQYFQ